MKLFRPLLSLLLVAMCSTTAASTSTSPTTTLVVQEEPAWGRIYLRRGLSPIQYFRDQYGGPMVQREVAFYFPKQDEDRLGCELLPPAEQDVIRASNGSIALVFDRGVCSFETKSRNAELMGAAALVIVSEDESAKAPVALAAKGEIEIATMMIRKSAGEMLRLVAQHQSVRGRIVPVVCERKPYVCKPRTDEEAQYVNDKSARSGVIVARATNETLGDFLTATFGSVLPEEPLQLVPGLAPIEGCEVDQETVQLAHKVALFAANSECSSLQRVSSAQLAGASAVLLAVGERPSDMQHPRVEHNWHAYNITIPSAAVTSATMSKLAELVNAQDGLEVVMEQRNRIADAWDNVRRLSVKTAWPSRKDRKEKVVQQVLSSHALDSSQLLELKNNYLSVAGGSGAAWDRMVTLPESEEQQEATTEISVVAEGV